MLAFDFNGLYSLNLAALGLGSNILPDSDGHIFKQYGAFHQRQRRPAKQSEAVRRLYIKTR